MVTAKLGSGEIHWSPQQSDTRNGRANITNARKAILCVYIYMYKWYGENSKMEILMMFELKMLLFSIATVFATKRN